MNNLLDIHGFEKHYRDFSLGPLDLTVPTGYTVGLIGSNGAGKTTLIKAALGLIGSDAGTIDVLGVNIGAAANTQETATIKDSLGIVFDTCAYPAEYRISDVLSLMRTAYSKWDDAAFERFLKNFGLAKEKKVKELSRGMGMKLSLACALSHNPTFLILDEATAGLDPLARDEILDVLRDFMRDERHGILMSSHITSDLEKIADYIVCIEDGKLVFSVEKDTITDRAGIAHCRSEEFEEVQNSGFFAPGEMHYLNHPHETIVLAPDRFEFAQRFPSISLDRANIDSYLTLTLKGSIR